MKRFLFLLLPFLAVPLLRAQDDKNAQVDVHTNAVCDMCVKTIETELLYAKGVRSVKVDLGTNTIHVGLNPRKTDVAKVRTAISKLGYSADDVAQDMKAREKLPDCCKKEGCGMPAAPSGEQH